MNEPSTPTWSQSMSGHHDPMVSAPEDDFANFLDLGDFQLNFPPFDTAGQQEALQQDVNSAMDMTYGDGGVTGDGNHMHQQQQDLGHHQLHTTLRMQIMDHSTAEAAMGLNAQMEYLQQRHHMQEQEHRRQSIIPPTPNSIEMHGGVSATRYYQQIDPQSLAFLERYQRLKEDQMIFTPLVSPAVTPLDSNFIVPEYTVPGAYFSPLTSPALEAQNQTHRSSYSNLSQYDTSLTTSPEMSVALPTSAVSTSTNSNSTQHRKTKRKLSTTRKPPARVVHQSPSMKPQTRRKAPPNAINSTKAYSEAIEDPAKTGESLISPRRTPGSLPLPYGQDSSEAESISPEPLSEALMAPPPPPGSSGRSPSINPKHKNGSAVGSKQADGSTGPAPATPASIMKLPNVPMQDATDGAETNGDFLNGSVVEPMTNARGNSIGTSPALPQLKTRRTDDQTTPTLGATRTPIVGAMSTPSTRDHSPNQLGSATPNGFVASKPVDTKTNGRGSKKRASASVQVSPALRPKISPSIKPLLPEGLSAETSALLLASKSNYQNIVEGNNLPGLSYPETLSTNLTSKRTSHKIAEQGRRNRINNALTEIASLLPKDSSSGKEAGSSGSGGEAGGSNCGAGGSSGAGGAGGGGGGAAQANSKASTVEMAIDYIKSLQRELRETKGKLEAAEKKLGEKG